MCECQASATEQHRMYGAVWLTTKNLESVSRVYDIGLRGISYGMEIKIVGFSERIELDDAHTTFTICRWENGI